MLSINLNNPLTTTAAAAAAAADYKSPKTHHTIPQMALRVHFLFPKYPSQTPKFQSHPFPTKSPQKLQISSKKNPSDAELASELASEVVKINTLLVQKQEAMRKSREILFTELCQHMGMSDNEVKRKWTSMEEDEKGSLVKGFVLEWGVSFHPLSVKSVIELVDEYLVQDENKSSALPSDSTSGGSMLFPSLRKLMGFSQNE